MVGCVFSATFSGPLIDIATILNLQSRGKCWERNMSNSWSYWFGLESANKFPNLGKRCTALPAKTLFELKSFR